jgi:hypothetical protein
MIKNLILIIITGLLWSCRPQGGDNKILTSNIFDRSQFEVDLFQSSGSVVDMGEHLLTSPPPEVTLRLTNNSDYPYTGIDIIFTSNDGTPTSLQFRNTPEGESQFPGHEGTCQRVLPSQQSCTVRIQFLVSDERLYQEKVTLNFKNLVSDESKVVNFKLLAGMPASLVFAEDTSRYTFGAAIGLQKKPIVERESDEIFQKILTIQNKGGLSARKINILPNESCRSTHTLSCPPGMLGAYSFENLNCPERLMPDEECRVEVKFKPKNSTVSPPNTLEDIFEIFYQYNLRFDYLSDTKDTPRSLNAFFDTNSTNIQANFKSSSENIIFPEPVVGGTREKILFQLTSNGYREGLIKKLSFRNSDQSLMANCFKGAEGNLLDCFKPSGEAIGLELLPFKIADLNGCVDSKNEDILREIPVDKGCLFEIIFQPSATHTSNQTYQNIILTVTFDARWKDLRTIIERQVALVSGQSLAPGRLVVETISFAGKSFSNLNQPMASVDLGRLTLQNAAFLKRRALLMVFRNTGSVPTSLIGISDGKNNNLLPGVASKLGTKNPVYYDAVTPTTSCTEVMPNQTCQITMQFAAVGYETNDAENAAMFDLISPTHGTPGGEASYKIFNINYLSGAKFTDSNFTETPDYPAQLSRAQITAILVRKGMLQELQDHPSNFPALSNSSHQDELISHVILQNIGTGSIPYIRLQKQFTNNFSSIIPTINLTELGVNHDCLDIVDAPTLEVPFDRSPQTREDQDGANFAPLGVGESCVFSIKSKLWNGAFTPYPIACLEPLSPSLIADQAISRITSGEWEPCADFFPPPDSMNFAYFDGDVTNPGASNPEYGERFIIPNFTRMMSMQRVANIVPIVSHPFMTSLLYRKPVAYSGLSAGPGGFVDPGAWFWDVVDSGTFSHLFSTTGSLFFVKSSTILGNLATVSPLSETRDDYDYYAYLGSFPLGSAAITTEIKLSNTGERTARVTSLDTIESSSEFQINSPSLPINVMGGQQVSIPVELNTTTLGEKKLVIEYEYETGAYNSPLNYVSQNNLPQTTGLPKTRTKKILVTAVISNELPDLSAQVFNYDISQNVSTAPTVEWNPTPTIASLSLNTAPATYTIAFDSIKLTSQTHSIQDMFDQKMIRYTNTSAYPLINFSLGYQSTALSKTILNSPKSLSRFGTNRETDCNNFNKLDPGESCDIIIRYQPLSSDTSQTITLAALYSSEKNEFKKQNIALSLNPRSPGSVVMTLASNNSKVNTETILYKPTSASNGFNRTSHIFGIGNSQVLNASPRIFTTTYRLSNTQSTKVSFLLSYHEYLRTFSFRDFSPETDLATMVNVVPEEGEYEIISGSDYLTVFKTVYTNGDPKTVYQVSRGCLFGMDETDGSVPSHMKGFDNTYSSCFLRVNFYATFDFMLLDITNSNGDIMRQVAANLKYFSFNRSGRNESLWVHIIGRINPNPSNASGSISTIQSYDNPRETHFTFPTFSPQNASMGEIVGIRILRSTSETALNNVYATNLTDYMDFRTDGTNPTNISFKSGFTNGVFYYYRAVAIRYNALFSHSSRFVNLSPGHYLSQINSHSTLRILMPPMNHILIPELNRIVEKTLATNEVTVDTFTQASSRCTGRSVNLILQGTTVNRKYGLITSNIWNVLKSRPDSTNYSSMLAIPHWLSDPVVSIDSQLSSTPGFMSGQSSQFLEEAKRFYVRNTSNPSASVRVAVGGVPQTNVTDFISFVDPAQNFGSARCMAELP